MAKHSMDAEEEQQHADLGLHMITHGYEKDINETLTKIVDGSLRSGKKIVFQGTVVILGDINAGAEVIAKEHVIVLGTIRGLAHAGATGNRKALIVANEIDAPQVRIANLVKEIERPVIIQEDDEEQEKEKEKNKKKKKKEKEEPEVEEIIEDIKTRAYVKGKEIILE